MVTRAASMHTAHHELPETRSRSAPLAALCAAVLSLCGCPLGSPNEHYRPIGHQDTTIDVSPADDAIVFNANGAGGRDLYLLRLGDLRVTHIAETPQYEVGPSFSPDGRHLVYAAGIPGDRADHIFTRAVGGGPARQLTDADANDSSPRFSPDGSTIVFARDKSYSWGGLAANWDTGGVICLIRSNGANERQLTADGVFAYEPRFSTDGKSVIFSTVDGLASISVDGSDTPKKITGIPGAVRSPDGMLLAYSKGRFSPDLKVYVANADGTSERLITRTIAGCYRPVFNKAGDRLFFFREDWPDGPAGVPKFTIWEAAVDGTALRRITDGRLFDDPLGWTPRDEP